MGHGAWDLDIINISDDGGNNDGDVAARNSTTMPSIDTAISRV
jgi:hypothetical protein